MSLIECRQLVASAYMVSANNTKITNKKLESLIADIKDIKLILKLHREVKNYYAVRGINQNFFVRDRFNNTISGLVNHYKPPLLLEDQDTDARIAKELEQYLIENCCCYFDTNVDSDNTTVACLTTYLNLAKNELQRRQQLSTTKIVPDNLESIIDNNSFIQFFINQSKLGGNLGGNVANHYRVTIDHVINHADSINNKSYHYSSKTSRATLYERFLKHSSVQKEYDKYSVRIALIIAVVVGIIIGIIVVAVLLFVLLTIITHGVFTMLTFIGILLAIFLALCSGGGSGFLSFGIVVGLYGWFERPNTKSLDKCNQNLNDYKNYSIVGQNNDSKKGQATISEKEATDCVGYPPYAPPTYTSICLF